MKPSSGIEDILKDIEAIIDLHRNPNLKRGLLTRIHGAIEAQRGLDKKVDTGPWEVSDDGRTLFSDDFEHDVTLKVSGDFYSDEQRVAYSKQLAKRLVGLPKEPPPALIDSMCLRYAHDFGLDKDPDAPLSAGWTDEGRDSLRRTMRQLYEEVAGHGFHKWG